MSGCCSKSKKSQLALSILEEHFGQKVAQVAAYLLSHERNSLLEIAQSFARTAPKEKLKLSAIKEVLLVLLQHQCLVMTRPSSTAGNNEEEVAELYSGLQYGLNLDAILYRLRFPHLLEICGKFYGDIAVNIMEELIQHGRLPMAMVLESVMKRLEEEGADEYTTQDDVMSVFEKLIQRRFIVPAQTLDVSVIRPLPPLEKGSDILEGIEKAPSSSSSSAKKRKTPEKPIEGFTQITTKKSRVTKTTAVSAAVLPSTVDEMLPLEIRLMMQKQQQLSAAAEASTSSSSAPSSLNRSTSASKRGGRGGRGRGRGRREEEPTPTQSSHRLLTSPSDLVAPTTFTSSSTSGPRDSVLWTIGWEQLDREERHQLCINVAHQRMGSLAGGIVKIILDRSMPTEMGSKQTHSSPMSLLDLCAILRESKASTSGAHSGVDIQTIRQVMDLLRCDALGIVDKITGNNTSPNGDSSSAAASQQSRDSGTQYTVNIAGICRAVGGRLMRNIAEEKFGKESARIVELLQKHKYLEQQKLSEMLILPAREGRERLYELFKQRWVSYLELSKRGDYGAASTSFFWNLDREKVQPILLEGMYGTLLNLRLRKQMEIEQGKDVLDFSHTITDKEEKRKFQRLCLALSRLDNSIMKVVENTLVLGAW
jgi:DNA-directed RNA polymerase III subunit RPC3